MTLRIVTPADTRTRRHLRGIDHTRPLVLIFTTRRWYACRICTARHGITNPDHRYATVEEHAAHITDQHGDW